MKLLKRLPREDRQVIGKTIDALGAGWGKPHAHAGIGVRKLARNLFECRAGLKTRLIFEVLLDDSFYFHILGDHDEIRRFIKSGRV